MRKDLSKGVERMLSGFKLQRNGCCIYMEPPNSRYGGESSDIETHLCRRNWILIESISLLMDYVIPHMHASTNEGRRQRKQLIQDDDTVLGGNASHNIPEGMAAGAACWVDTLKPDIVSGCAGTFAWNK